MVRVVFLACFFSSKLYYSINILLGQSISSQISITALNKYFDMIPGESEKYQANNYDLYLVLYLSTLWQGM